MSDHQEFFTVFGGAPLRSQGGKSFDLQSLQNQTAPGVIGLYFSAHWCPPCQKFTPELSRKYVELKKAGKNIEIIFISSDKSQEEFEAYHDTMTFPALPFQNKEARAKLGKKYKVEGIPTLIFLDAQTLSINTDEGREEIDDDNFINNFPYKPKPLNLLEELGPVLLSSNGSGPESIKEVPLDSALKDKEIIALYFSAHWCPPCRGFTPTLSKKYLELKKAHNNFELVFISSDRDEKAFKEYHGEMTFLAMPYSQRTAKANLSKFFKIQGIPTLIFYNLKTNKIITEDGRAALESDDYLIDFPYHPKPVNDISLSLTGINEKPSLLILMEEADKETKKSLTNILTKLHAESKGETFCDPDSGVCHLPPKKSKEEEEADKDKPKVELFFTGCGGGPVDKIRFACGVTAPLNQPSMVILDLDDEGAVYLPNDPQPTILNEETIKSFLNDFSNRKLSRNTFGQPKGGHGHAHSHGPGGNCSGHGGHDDDDDDDDGEDHGHQHGGGNNDHHGHSHAHGGHGGHGHSH